MPREQRSGRTRWVVLGGLLAAAAAGGAWAYSSPAVQARYAAYRFHHAADDTRKAWADRLAALGDDGLPPLLGALKADDPAAVAALGKSLDALPDGDPRAVALAGRVLDSGAGPKATFALLPVVLKRTGTAHAERCRAAVAAALASPDASTRLAAVPLALHPAVNLRASVVPLLNAPEAEVRRAAMFAVGPASDGDPVVGDEELARWLHDPDAAVRAATHAALGSRGRTDAEIALAGRLTDPDATRRLAFAADLRFDDDDVRDPAPWLERLGHDTDPAVRVAAARVAVERKLSPTPWVDRLADADPDPTVRGVVGFWRGEATRGEVRAVSFP